MIRYGQYGRKASWIVKRYEKYGGKVSWIVIRFGKYRRKVSWIVKRCEKYERKVSWIFIRFGKYRRKVSWIVKRFGKYRRKLWNDRENTEENCENIGHKMATLEIKGPGFAQTQKCDGVKPVKRNPNPSDNWVSYSSQVGY